MEKPNIALIGFMGAGKTTIGKLLAKALNWRFVDTDRLIAKKEGQAITDIFAQGGESAFRTLEEAIIQEVTAKQQQVIACGGGAILSHHNRQAIWQRCLTISLSATAEVLWQRLKHDTTRPLLQVDNPQGHIGHLLQQRTPYYNQAHIHIDTSHLSAEEVVDLILAHLMPD